MGKLHVVLKYTTLLKVLTFEQNVQSLYLAMFHTKEKTGNKSNKMSVVQVVLLIHKYN